MFLCALLFGALWRLTSPDIVEDNDRLSDFHLVSNYLSGERLPPVDNWLPYQRLNYYYSFQHYSAALLGRLFGLGPGAASIWRLSSWALSSSLWPGSSSPSFACVSA